jgi:hypothetical protein
MADQIDDQPMDVRCFGHKVHIFFTGRAWMRLFRTPVGIQLNVGGN